MSKNRQRRRWASIALRGLAAFLLLWTFEAAPAAAKERGVRTRDGESVTGARGSTPSTARRPSARDTRQNPPRHSTRGGSHHHGRRYGGHYYDYGGHYYPRLGFSYWGYPFYWGYYPGGYYGYYGHYGLPYRSYRASYHLGALDLNVKPKKAEVYVDGQYVGLVREYDGFPSFLWLERGRYEIAFYLPGYATQTLEVKVLSGAVVPVRLRLPEGEAVKPQRAAKPRPEPWEEEERRADRPRSWERPQRDAPAPSEERDVRREPGRVRLEVSPPDASVYLDGRFLGSGDEVGRLHSGLIVEPGEHVLEVVRPGFASERLEFEVEGGDDLDLEVRLADAAV